MNFGEAIERVKTRSYIARRANWDNDVFIFAQVPADITYYTPTGDEIFANDWETKSDDTLAEWENI